MTYHEFLFAYLSVGLFDEEKEEFVNDNGGTWLEDYPDEKIPVMLSSIWDVAKGGFNALRNITGLSQRAFAEQYSISARTLEKWSTGERTSPPYVLTLLAYAVLKDEKII